MNTCIFTAANDLFEYIEDTRDAAVYKYVEEQLIAKNSFSLATETWANIKTIIDATDETKFEAFIDLINGLCVSHSQKITKVFSGYTKDYAKDIDVEDVEEEDPYI